MNVSLLHGLDQPQRADHVVVVICERITNRLGNGFQSGEMDDGAASVQRQCLKQRVAVANIAVDRGGRDPGDALDPVQHLVTAIAEIVGLFGVDGTVCFEYWCA